MKRSLTILCINLSLILQISLLLLSCQPKPAAPAISEGDTFQLSLQVAPADTAQLRIFLQPQESADADVTELTYDGTAYTGSCPCAASRFYTLTCIKDGGQYIIPVPLDGAEAKLNLSFAEGMPLELTFANKVAKGEAETLKAMNDYRDLSSRLIRDFWMNQRPAETVSDYAAQLLSCSKDVDGRRRVPADVKQFIKVWSYLDVQSLVDGYNRMHHDAPISVDASLLPAACEVLDCDAALLHTSAPLTAFTAMPKGSLAERFSYLYEHYHNIPMREAIQARLLNAYVRNYKFADGIDNGLQELTEMQQQYGFDDSYIANFRKRMAAVKGAPFPAVRLEDAAGNAADMSAFKGKYVYVDLWASWCVPCCREVPHLQKLEESLEGSSVAFVSISCDTDRDAWKQKMADLHVHGNQFIDASGELCEQLNVSGIPHFLVYDPDGRLYLYDAPRPSHPQTKNFLKGLQ